MYSFPLALVVVAVVSTAGACLNYELSALLVRDMIIDLVPARISVFHHSVQKHQDHLLNYFVFLRVRSNFQDAYLKRGHRVLRSGPAFQQHCELPNHLIARLGAVARKASAADMCHYIMFWLPHVFVTVPSRMSIM